MWQGKKHREKLKSSAFWPSRTLRPRNPGVARVGQGGQAYGTKSDQGACTSLCASRC